MSLRSFITFDVELFLRPVSFELVCLCTVMRNKSCCNARADVRTPNCPPPPIDFSRGKSRPGNWCEVMAILLSRVPFFVLRLSLWSISLGACRLLRWTINVLEFQGSVSLLNTLLSITLFKRFVGCIYRSLRELCTTPQFAVLLVSRWTRNTPTFAVCRNVRKLEHCTQPKKYNQKNCNPVAQR